MKKNMILAAMTALVLAAGCAKNEVFTTPQDQAEMPVGFSNYVPRNITKADASLSNGATLVNGQKFAVYSYATVNGVAFTTTAIGTNFMNGVEVTYTAGGDSDASKNTYSPMRYWPSGNTPDWLTFWAYYPVSASNGITYTAPTGDNDLGSYSFTAAATAASMVDFMVSDVVNDKIYGTTSGTNIAVNGVVPLTFKHQLTKVGFQFKTDLADTYTKVVLTGATLKNARTTGTLSATYSNGDTSTDWGSTATTPADYSITVSGSTVSALVLSGAAAGESSNSDFFLMVPQTMDGDGTDDDDHEVELTWKVKTFDTAEHAAANAATATTVGSDGLVAITSNTATVKLATVQDGNSATISSWDMNMFITYTFTIGPKPIRFTATVIPWDSEVTGSISVN